MRIAEIDATTGNYKGIVDAINSREIPSFMTKIQAQDYAKRAGWYTSQVLQVKRRFQTLWHVGYQTQILEDNVCIFFKPLNEDNDIIVGDALVFKNGELVE